MKRLIMLSLMVGLAACDRKDGGTGAGAQNSPAGQGQAGSNTGSSASQEAARTATGTESANAKAEREARDAGEKMLSDWRDGHKPEHLVAIPDLTHNGVLLDFKLVSLKRNEWTDNGALHHNFKGTVNLQFQTEGGTPATKQYRVTLANDGKDWHMILTPA